MIVMCSACRRVKVKGGYYDEKGNCWSHAVDPDPSQPNAITHNLCPECADKPGRDAIVARLERFSGGKDETEGGT